MKYLIASDIHGSFYYAQKLIELFDKMSCDKIILLGDILYHGPRNDLPGGFDPKQEAALLNEYKDVIISARGNCDAQIDLDVLEFDLSKDYFVLEDNSKKIFFTHGHIYGPDNYPPSGTADVLVFGHYHVPCDYMDGNLRLINPGSTSIPKENSRHSAIILEDGIFRWYDLDLLEEYQLSSK